MLTELERQTAHIRDVKHRLRNAAPPKKILENCVALPVADETPRSSTSVVIPKATVDPAEADRAKVRVQQIQVELRALNERQRELRKELGEAAQREIDLQPTPLPIKAVALAVATYYAVPYFDLVGESRHRQIAWPRQIAMYLSRKMHKTHASIGRHFNRDHTTVMHSCAKITKQRENNPSLDRQLKDIAVLLSGETA